MHIRPAHIALLTVTVVMLFVLYAASISQRERMAGDGFDGLAPPVSMSIEDAPAIELERTHLDLGIIPPDQDTSVTVNVYNRGRSTLDVRDVRSSCPLCTVGAFAPHANSIAPGASAPLTVTKKPGGILGFHSRKTLTLTTNDPRNPQMTLTVEANVDPEFILEPEDFDFGAIAKGQEAKVQLLLRQRIQKPVTVQGVSLQIDNDSGEAFSPMTFTVILRPEAEWRTPGKREYVLEAVASPLLRPGDFEIPVFIHTDVKRLPYHRVSAHGTVVAPYTLDSGSQTNLLLLRNRASIGRITVEADEPVTLGNVRSEQGHILLEVETLTPETAVLLCKSAPHGVRGIHADAALFEVEIGGTRYPERIPIRAYVHNDMQAPETVED